MRGPVALVDTFELLTDDNNVSYVLSADLCVVHTNKAWEQFALANGGELLLATWKTGTSLVDVIPTDLERFFRDGFSQAAESQQRWEHDYECSSPAVHRRFRMIVYPFSGAFIVTHAPLVERERDPADSSPGPAYERAGVITMCSHCRRVRHATGRERWDFVPGYVDPMPPNVSHGLCPPCFRFYYA